jgi:hypothetical protein
MNYCTVCKSLYERPGTCNCYAGVTPGYPYYPYSYYPTWPYSPYWTYTIGDYTTCGQLPEGNATTIMPTNSYA